MDRDEYVDMMKEMDREAEFWRTHDREDARPEWEDLTPEEQREEDPERYRDENSEPDPDDLRDNRIFEEGLPE